MHRTLVWTGKGGTGKSTTVANVAVEIARLGYRVLMVGFDPQADLESTFGVEEDDRDIARVEQLLAGGIDPHDALVRLAVPRCEGSLALLACSSDLNSQMAAVSRRGFGDLDRLLACLDEDFDLAIIDTQGALTPLSHTAALAADTILFTLEPGPYEYRALARRLAEIKQIASEESHAIRPLGVFFVRSAPRSRHRRDYAEHLADAEAFGEELYVFRAYARQEAAVRDDAARGAPTAMARPSSKVACDYRALAAELIDRIADDGQQSGAEVEERRVARPAGVADRSGGARRDASRAA